VAREPEDRMSGRSFWSGVTLAALGGLAIRVAYTLVVDPKVQPVSDATTYHLLANHLAAGKGWVRPYELEWYGVAPPTAEFPPLFPALLSVVAWLGGTAVQTQRLVNCVIGAGTVIAIGMLARRVGGGAVGVLAAAIAAVYPMLFWSDGALMPESLATLLVVLVLLAAYRVVDSPTRARFLVLGALVGLAALVRTEALLFLPLLVLPLAGRRWAAALVALVAAGVVLAPWTIRNALVFRTIVPVSNNSGTLIAGANCEPVYRGPQIGLWRLDCVTGIVRGFDEVDTASRYRAAGVRFAREHLGDVPRVVAVRWLRALSLWDPSQQLSWESLEGRPRVWGWRGMLMWWALAPLAIAGALLVARRGGVPLWPLLCPLVLAAITVAVSYGNERFRQPAEPSVLVLAAVAPVTAGRARGAAAC
jgi:hypothetical protein